MTADEFRRLALSLPESDEGSHHGHADFRVAGKIFATLGPDLDWGMVKLDPETQSEFVAKNPRSFEAFPGAWGAQGSTRVTLAHATEKTVSDALGRAWRRTAPKKLRERYDAPQ